MMEEYNSLTDYAWQRRRFDPSNKEDLKELAYFKKNGTWKNCCPFLIEWPYKDVISMCQARYTDYVLMSLKK